MKKLELVLCQLPSLSSKYSTVSAAKGTAYQLVEQYVSAAKARYPTCQMVVFPEAWSLPYSPKFFSPFSEEVPEPGDVIEAKHPSIKLLSDLALKHKIWIIGGSVAEKLGDKLFNTAVVMNPDGVMAAKHRKVHLFDIDVPGKMTFKESEVLSPGNKITTFPTPWGIFGLGICYDLRFAEMAMAMRRRGAKAIFYPGAFNTTTGGAHWSAILRGRAIDTQCYVIACSPVRCLEPDNYPAWGHSLAVDPWGTITADVGERAGLGHAELDLDYVDEVRQNIPIGVQWRKDIYEIDDKNPQ